jgi:hypothetical protein
MKTKTSGTRVPRKLGAFDQYIRRVIAFLIAGSPTNGSRLLLTAAEIAQAQGFLTLWYTGNASSPGAWELHSNPNTKNKSTRKAVMKIIKDFSTFFGPLLNRMNGCAAVTAADRLILNIADPNPLHTRHSEGITDLVNFILVPKGGGDMRIICRTSTDTKRASKSSNADSIQICYKVGDPAPVSTDDATAKTYISSKASFTLQLGTANIGKKIYVYTRWYNIKHPELAGHWSSLEQAMIS